MTRLSESLDCSRGSYESKWTNIGQIYKFTNTASLSAKTLYLTIEKFTAPKPSFNSIVRFALFHLLKSAKVFPINFIQH